LIEALHGFGATLADHCQRTWLFVKDVDVFYEGLVQSRAALFATAGLTPATHYIASTGIEGGGADPFGVITMDAYSSLDIDPAQVSYLDSVDMLCKTDLYHVTFERGTRLSYRDRRHFFISGTASIDAAGHTLHHGDVVRQCDRAIENIRALLASGGATLSDLQYVIVYLRDPADHDAVQARLSELLGPIPGIIVQGAVCRPAWLIEIEGVAAAVNNDPGLPVF
jgi:enamine deaminase RidA (YjgF/YER057c/UK114 family)